MIKKLIGAIALSMLFAASANAANMSITGPSTDVMAGDSFILEIWGDFTGEGLTAGGITFSWVGAMVQLTNITLELAVDDDFSCPGSNPACPPLTTNTAPIVWGDFFNALIEVDAPSPTLMATLTFTALGGPGFVVFDMSTAVGFGPMGWFGPDFAPLNTPGFSGYAVNIVPLPAAIWFLVGGLGTLLGFRRK